MPHIFREDPFEGTQICVGHGLDNELFITTKEEKAPTLSLRFTCLEDSLDIFLRIKRFINLLVIYIVEVAKILEDFGS